MAAGDEEIRMETLKGLGEVRNRHENSCSG